MIQTLSIRNFKSIRELDLECRRVNVVIGEPNTGKTNVLEALALRSTGALLKFGEVLRVSSIADLHLNQDVGNPIQVSVNGSPLRFNLGPEETVAVLGQPNGGGHQAYHLNKQLVVLPESVSLEDPAFGESIRYYLFESLTEFPGEEERSLSDPFGENLFRLLYSNKAARLVASHFFDDTGFRLNLDVSENKLKISKLADELLISLPYHSSSETLRRMIFYSLALETNTDRVLLFDEPEAHAFPPFTKILAERIALDERGNQFFLTTHSPYMLDSLLSKTPAVELNVLLCRMEGFETKVHPLDQDQIDQLKEWSMDAFFNFDRLLPEV